MESSDSIGTSNEKQPRSQARRIKPSATFPEEFEAIAYAGGGTLAEVWQARNRETGKIYAVKQLRQDWADYPVAKKLLENEAEVGAAVDSPYVVKVLQSENEAVPPFLVMEWLEGRSLERSLRNNKRLDYADAIWIARQCAEGLEALRQSGFTHGDVKPANILLGADGSIKLLDLGFARRCRKSDHDLSPTIDILTGTPEYLAPEILTGGLHWGVARDIYSLGVTLYRMLTGRLPFGGDEMEQVLREQRESRPENVRQFAADVPHEIEKLVRDLLAKQPIRRPESLQRLIRTLIELELSTLPTGLAAA